LPSYSVYYVEGTTHADPSAEALQEAPVLPRRWRETISDREDAEPILIKTHEAPSDSAPAVFIARDGRAAIHSYYHYHKKFSFEQPSLTEIIAGACQFGSWSEHYWAWSPKTRPKTLLIGYDDLVCHPGMIVQRLAAFLNLNPENATLPEFEALQKRSPEFFRRGQNTDYLSEWTQAQLELFNQLHASAMKDLGFGISTGVPFAGAEVVKELAQSAARLHRMYLEQLSSFGEAAAQQQATVQDLSNQIEQLSNEVMELSRQIDQELKP
jgi:hypothetical protein